MDRGTYALTTLGMAKMRQLEVVNNNLANVNTPGFKRQVLVGESQSFDQTLASLVKGKDPYAEGDHERTPGVITLETRTDFSQGPIRETGNPFDVALTDPKEFFVVNTPQGARYTRAGNFTLSTEGTLVNADGFEVQGDGGPITITLPNGRINEDGSVSADGVLVGRLQIVRFEDTSGLSPAGATQFTLNGKAAQPQSVQSRVVPAALEMSNVSSISSVIDLITTNRGFEAYTKSAQTIDQMNQTAITQVGKSR